MLKAPFHSPPHECFVKPYSRNSYSQNCMGHQCAFGAEGNVTAIGQELYSKHIQLSSSDMKAQYP